MRASGICLRFSLALLAMAPAALPSQPIYRCGNAYSQTPCANAVVVKADDARTPDQKAQTDAATVQAARLAERMERDRQASEHRSDHAGTHPARARPALPPATKPRAARQASPEAPSSAKTHPKSKSKSRSPLPDYFTAAARQDEKKKAAPVPTRD